MLSYTKNQCLSLLSFNELFLLAYLRMFENTITTPKYPPTPIYRLMFNYGHVILSKFSTLGSSLSHNWSEISVVCPFLHIILCIES